MRSSFAVMMFLALLPTPASGSEISRTVTADGNCEKLVVSGDDLSAECGTALIQLHYDDDRVSVSSGTGGQSFFGLGEPERVLMFSGPGTGEAWSDHAVDQVLAADDAGHTLLFSAQASGACTYQNEPPGMLVSCEATDNAGRHHALVYRTDGLPGFSF